MMQNPQNYEGYIAEVLSSLSSKDRYFKAYYNPNGYYKSTYPHMKPYFIVYRNETLTFQDLMNQFAQQHPQFTFQQGMIWQLYQGLKIAPSLTIEEFKKQLRQESVDGMNIFVYEKKDQWIDQAAVTSFLKKSPQFNSRTYEAPFIIQSINHYIYIPLTPSITIDKVKQALQKEILSALKGNVDTKNMEISFKKQQKLIPLKEQHLTKYNNSSHQKFIVTFKNKVLLKPPPKQNNTFIKIQGQGITSKIFDYDQIKDKKLCNVLEDLILNKKQQKYAVIIEEQLLRFNQYLSKLDKIFKNSSTSTKHLIGYYVNEYLAFEYQYKKIVNLGHVNIKSIHINQKNNLERLNQCNEKIKARAKSTKHSHFKNTQNVQPILLYTSQVIVVGSNDHKNKKSNYPIYCALNTYMRTNNFCDYAKDSWEFKFAAHLYYQQKKIPLVNKTLWRGIKYPQNCIIGDQIHFKQFSSTSTSKKQAENFAEKGLFMILNSKTAHPIKQYSFYQTQEEALVEPYSTWKVIKKWKLTKETIKSKTQEQLLKLDSKTYQQWIKKQKGGNKIDLIIVEELEKPKLPQMKSTVFLWVDDKTGEGEEIWQRIEEIKNTTVMIPLLTTAELQKWLKDHSQMVKDPQIELIMITNMTRVQKGKKEDKAGVYAIDAFRKYKPKGTVFVYIGWLQGTINKLKEHNYIPDENMLVKNQLSDMTEFLKEKGLKSK